MSGPKTSRYTVTSLQRRILEEQRRLEQQRRIEQQRILEEQRKIEQRKNIGKENIKRTQKRLLQIGGMFDTDKQIAAELTSRVGSDNGITRLIEDLEVLLVPVQPLVAQTNYNDVNSIERTVAEIGSLLVKAEELTQKIESISSKNKVKLNVNLQEAIDRGFTTPFTYARETEETSSSSLYEETAEKLIQLKKTTFLPQSYIDEIEAVSVKLSSITNDGFRKNFIALTVNPLLKKTNQFISEYAECQDEFEKLYTEYVALCELYYYVAQEYVCSRASIQELQSEIQRIKDIAAEDDEQAYISDCLDEVMTEMGYSVLGSREVTKRNGKHFRNELYTYEEGTAVNITYSSDGRIAMELGGIDTNDRVPTAQEAEKLCDSMEQFCDDFKEIEKRLLAKGVVLAERVSLLPPNAAYAQIINTADYSLETEADAFNVKKQRKTATKPKTMRSE